MDSHQRWLAPFLYPFLGFVEDLSRKYHFECCSQEQCQEWMEALRRARWGFGNHWELGGNMGECDQ